MRDYIRNNNTSHNRIAWLLTAWTHHMCVHGLPRKTHCTLSSIKRFFSEIAIQLLLLCPDDPSVHESEIDFESIYQRLLSGKNKPAYALHRIMYFHSFCAEFSEIEDIDFYAIFPEFISDTLTLKDIDQITHQEYLTTQKLIDKTQSLSSINKAKVLFSLTCGYKCGLRINEVFRLRGREIFVDSGDHLNINVSSSGGDTVKTLAANRLIVSFCPLTNNEKDSVELLKKHLVSFHSLNDKLINTNNEQDSFDRHNLYAILHPILRRSTGNPAFRDHHLRHSFCNIISANEFQANFGKNYKNLPMYNLLHADLDCVSPHPSPNWVNTIADKMGHSSINSALCSYIHIVDQFFYHYQQSIPVPLSYGAALYASNYNKTSIDEKTPKVLTTIDYPHQRKPEKSPIKESSTRDITLSDVNPILYRYVKAGRRVTENLLGEHYSYHDISQLIDIAKEIEHRGYKKYALNTADTNILNAVQLEFSSKTLRKDFKRKKKFISTIDSIIQASGDDKLSDILSDLDTWLSCYYPTEDQDFLTIERFSELEAILRVYDFIQFPSNNINISISDALSSEKIYDIKKKLQSLNDYFSINTNDNSYLHVNSRTKQSRIVLSMSRCLSGIDIDAYTDIYPLQYFSSLTQMVFLMTIFLSFNHNSATPIRRCNNA